MRILFFIACCTVILLSCSDNEQKEQRTNGYETKLETKEDSLYHDVMEGHDVGMAKMGQLKKYLNLAQQELDSMSNLPEEKLDVLYRQAVIDIQEDLNYAEYSMNTWMDEFKVDSGKDNPDIRIKYLEAEKEKVSKVKENILSGLQRADSLFKK